MTDLSVVLGFLLRFINNNELVFLAYEAVLCTLLNLGFKGKLEMNIMVKFSYLAELDEELIEQA